MKKCIVIGGGIAGLTSAVYLSKSGIKTEVIESKNKLGGRAYSIKDRENKTVIDNGQHILMGCYKETLKFISLINASDNFFYQRQLFIPFINSNSEIHYLEATKLFYPLNLFIGLLNHSFLNFSEKISLTTFFIKLAFSKNVDLNKLTVEEWLICEKQNENIRKTFWEIICVGTLNSGTKNASAQIFKDILKKMFLDGNFSSTLIIPQKGLSETYCQPANNYINKMGNKISLNENIIELKIENNSVTKIITDKRIIEDFDFVISAVPLTALTKFYSGDEIKNISLEYSCIISIHIWLKINKLKNKFYGLINSPIHWVFNHDDHITLVISDANYLIKKSNDEIIDMCFAELKKYIKTKREDIIDYKIIKEKSATFIPNVENLNKRQTTKTKINNLFLAGDWTDTGLPATLEGAVISGKKATDLILKTC
ncbi:MAG: hypothetical protein CO128_06080 [Ignavibacteriales bacterium CG_4_9_14_3_um_filter_30_11]|nr:MAG: hypothetical protein CO128_06080 [Ignavibacteriales bacterium CG_4_9_14_3_um_filter_30_11]